MSTAITTLFQWLFGIKSEQDCAIDRNRRMAEQQMAAFRDPARQFGSDPYANSPGAPPMATQGKRPILID